MNNEIKATKQPENNPIKRNIAKPTRGNAIKAKCAECMGCTANQLESGFRSSIRDCSSFDCPLYAFRPYQKKTGSVINKDIDDIEQDDADEGEEE